MKSAIEIADEFLQWLPEGEHTVPITTSAARILIQEVKRLTEIENYLGGAVIEQKNKLHHQSIALQEAGEKIEQVLYARLGGHITTIRVGGAERDVGAEILDALRDWLAKYGSKN